MQAECVKLEGSQRFTRLLAGRPQTSGMKSGLVTLLPGDSVGEHVTEGREEAVIILAGTAEVSIGGTLAFTAGENRLVYIPPETPHDIRNAGAVPLRYVYVVSSVLPEGKISA